MPQQTWSEKDERKYRHIRASAKARGASEPRAKEIAARTVNKGRRLQGRTANKTTMGTGNPRKPVDQRTKQELMNLARELGIAGRSRMSKGDLTSALRGRRAA